MQTYPSLVQALAAAQRPNDAIETAQRGIEVARATKQEAMAQQIEEWLKNYQAELRRGENVGSP